MNTSSFSTLITFLSSITKATRTLRFTRLAGIVQCVSPIRIRTIYNTLIIIIKIFNSRRIPTTLTVIGWCAACNARCMTLLTFKGLMYLIISNGTIIHTFIIIHTFEIRFWICWIYFAFCAFIKTWSITSSTSIFTL